MPPGTGAAVAAAINAGKPIATHSEGWSNAAIGIWTGVGIIVPLLITAMVKLLPVMRKLAIEREASLDDERKGDMAGMRRRIELLERNAELMRASFEAEIAKMRHRANNAEQALDMLLALLDAAPEKVREHVVRIMKIREDQRAAARAESGTIDAAKILAAAGTPPPAEPSATA